MCIPRNNSKWKWPIPLPRLRLLHFAALALALVMPVSSSAMHPILVYSGQLRLDSNELVVRITLDAHSLNHTISGQDCADRAERMARDLSRSLVLLDQRGDRIEPRSVSVSPAPEIIAASLPPDAGATIGQMNHAPRCVIRYTLADSVRLVVFQYRVSRDSPVVHRQIQLTAIDDRGNSLGLLRLSTGGNIEVIAIEDITSDQRILRREDGWVESFQVPHITTRVENREFVVEVSMPAPLLSTWFSMSRHSFDVLAAEDVEGLRPTLQSWFDRQLLITMNGKVASPASMRVSLHPLDRDLVPNMDSVKDSEGSCFWVSSILFVARFPYAETTPGIELTWRGFNGAVLQAIAEVSAGDAKHAAIKLTPSAPSLRILPGEFTPIPDSPQ